MMLSFALAAAFSTSQGELICRYDPDRNGNQIVLRNDGSIRFVSLDVADNNSVMKADIYRRTASSLVYKLVLAPERTDIFRVSLRTLRGTQTLDHGTSEQATVYRLVCTR